jgi:hypothetical protein
LYKSFFDVLPEVQKQLENIIAKIGFFENLVQKNYARNLRSKLAMSTTLTSPSAIRVHVAQPNDHTNPI